MSNPSMCTACGGTGDHFDVVTDDWADPWTECFECHGTGEVEE